MRYSDLYVSITEQFKTTNKIAFFIKGPPGCAKTALAKQIGRDLNFDQVEFFYASMREPTDLLGTPDNKGEVTRCRPRSCTSCARAGTFLSLTRCPTPRYRCRTRSVRWCTSGT
jgi:hypothetical protein